MPSNLKYIIQVLTLALLGSCCAQGQPPSAALLANTQNMKTVAAGTLDTIPLKLNPSATEGDFIHVIYADPSLAISLVLPNGTVVNAANASSLRYEWEHVTRTDLDEDTLLPFDVEGEHVLIGQPGGAPRGTYNVRVDASAATVNASVLVQVMMTSDISASLVTMRERYTPNETVVFTGVTAEGTQILQNPTMTLTVARTAPVTAGLSLTNVRFVRSQALADGGYRHYFTGDLVSQSVTAKMVSAQAVSPDGTFSFARDRLSFPSVTAGSTATTPTTVSVDTDSATAPSTSGWVWSFESTDQPVTVSMQDSGTEDGVPGDGLFTGVLVPSQTGHYSASLAVSGISPSGAEYSQVAATSFRVEAESGSVLACSDQPWDDDGDGLYDRLETTMQVRVGQAARYRLHLNLQDALGNTVATDASEDLSSGDQQVPLQFSAHRLKSELASDGPYQRTYAQLWFADNGRDELLSSVACGTTPTYHLADFADDPVRLTGAGTLTPVDQNGIAGYESLNYSQQLTAPAGDCSWYATLNAADGTRLDTYSGNSNWAGGTGTITGIFSGPKINHSGKSGPYQLASLHVTCLGYDVYKRNSATSGAYSAGDFEGTPADFTISATSITAQAGLQATSAVFTTASGGLDAAVDLAVGGLPSGWTASLQLPAIDAGGAVNLYIVPASSAAEGSYPLTVTGVSGNLTHTAQMTVTVTANPVTVSIQPGYATLHPGQTKQFSAQVQNAPDASFVWRTPSLGTLTAGLYQAPSIISSRVRIYVVAASTLDSSKLAGAYVDLLPPASVTVSPATATLSAGQSQYVSADVQNVQSPSVTWSMSPQVGTLSATSATRAVYVAPASVTTPQTITITATSVEDPSQATSMTISLQP